MQSTKQNFCNSPIATHPAAYFLAQQTHAIKGAGLRTRCTQLGPVDFADLVAKWV